MDAGVAKFYKMKIHSSHRFKPWYSDIRSPSGTPRFYGVRECKKCGGEEIKHAAGHFIDDCLFRKCSPW